MACCEAFGNTDLADLSADLDCCTLTFSNTVTGDILFQFRLDQTIVLVSGDSIKIRDGMSTINIDVADLTTLGQTVLGITTAADDCRCAAGAGSAPGTSSFKSTSGFNAELTATGEDVYVEVLTSTTGASTYRIHTATGQTDVANLSTITLGGSALSSRSIFKTCYIDDVASDGSNLVQFVRYTSIDIDKTVGIVGDFLPDLVTPYVVQGTIETSSTIGDAAEIKQEQLTISDGGTWSPTQLVRSYSYIVASIGDTNNPPTFTTSSGVVVDLFQNENATYPLDGEADLMEDSPVFTTNTGDLIKIIYTTL